jgi:ketosteroid isomerase-like protein
MLFHVIALAAATTLVAMGSRTQSAHGIMPRADEGPAVSIRSPIVDTATAEKQIATCEKTWMEAHRRGDAALLRRLLASEFTFTDPAGHVEDAKAYMSSLGSDDAASAPKIESIENKDTKLHVYGGTAVVSGQTVARGNKGFRESTRFLRVYVNRDGRWQMVAGQDTHSPANG